MMDNFHVTVPRLDKKYYTVHTNTSAHVFFVMGVCLCWVLKITFLSSWDTVTGCWDVNTKDDTGYII